MLKTSACCIPKSLTALCGRAWPFLDEDYSTFMSVRPVCKLKRHAVHNGAGWGGEWNLGRK